MEQTDYDIQDLRRVALEAPQAHLFKFMGIDRQENPVAFHALVLPEEGFIEGDLNLPTMALQLANEAMQILVWKGLSYPLFMMKSRKDLDPKKLDGYVTTRWYIQLPERLENLDDDFYLVRIDPRVGGVRTQRQEEVSS